MNNIITHLLLINLFSMVHFQVSQINTIKIICVRVEHRNFNSPKSYRFWSDEWRSVAIIIRDEITSLSGLLVKIYMRISPEFRKKLHVGAWERSVWKRDISRYLEVRTNFIFGGATRAFPVITGTSINRNSFDNILITVGGRFWCMLNESVYRTFYIKFECNIASKKKSQVEPFIRIAIS